jgi:hypothetical protein
MLKTLFDYLVDKHIKIIGSHNSWGQIKKFLPKFVYDVRQAQKHKYGSSITRTQLSTAILDEDWGTISAQSEYRILECCRDVTNCNTRVVLLLDTQPTLQDNIGQISKRYRKPIFVRDRGGEYQYCCGIGRIYI